MGIEEGITVLTPLDFTFYPYSHSLLMSVVWGALFGLVYFLVTKNRRRALILGALVVSHWFLDLFVHRPDLPLSPFSDFKVGFGLWNHPAAEMIIEFSLFFGAAYLYFTSIQPCEKIAY
ncbi:MAG: metal-dependent hydrolase [Flavobacteriales bacterium]